MDTIWIISAVVQWLVIAGLGVVVVSLVRQLGVLTVRMNPAAAYELDEGPPPGSTFPPQTLETLDGEELGVGQVGAQPTVVVFVAPGCGPCETLSPTIRKVARADDSANVRFVVSIGADSKTAAAYAKHYKLGADIKVVAGSRLSKNLGVSTTPYALAVGTNGLVAKRGVVNALEHLEEMVVLADTGVHSPSGHPQKRDMSSTNGDGEAPTSTANGDGRASEIPALSLHHVGEEQDHE